MKHITLLMAICVLLACVPAHAGGPSIDVVGGLTRLASVKPGSTVEGKILVRNTGNAPGDVKVFLTDYLFYADGVNKYDEPGTNPRSNAAWITFTPRQFTVPANNTVAVQYAIQVPADPKLVGTYWSMLMIEPIPPGALDAPTNEKDKVKVGVQTVLRYGMQMITDFPDTGSCSVKFSRQQLVKEDNKLSLLLDIDNTGERYLTPAVWAELFDGQGISLGRFEGGRLRLYPGCSGRFRIDLSQLSKSKYDALLVADNGDDHVFGTQLKLDIP